MIGSDTFHSLVTARTKSCSYRHRKVWQPVMGLPQHEITTLAVCHDTELHHVIILPHNRVTPPLVGDRTLLAPYRQPCPHYTCSQTSQTPTYNKHHTHTHTRTYMYNKPHTWTQHAQSWHTHRHTCWVHDPWSDLCKFDSGLWSDIALHWLFKFVSHANEMSRVFFFT